MNSPSDFRGVAGELVAEYLHPKTLLTIIPVSVALLVIWMALDLASNKLHPMIGLAIFTAFYAYFVGRFAIPALQGNYNSGLLYLGMESFDVVSFTLRYCAVALLWGVPAYFLGRYAATKVASTVGGFLMGAFLGGFGGNQPVESPFYTGCWLVVLLALLIFIELASVLTFVVAATTNEIGEAIGIAPWRWLAEDRGRDLPQYLSSIYGGIIVHFLIYLVPLTALALPLFFSLERGSHVIYWVLGIPAFGSAALIGKLTGALVAEGGDAIEQPRLNADAILKQTELPAVRPLSEDPSDQLLSWLKAGLALHAEVSGAYLYLSPQGFTLALELAEQTTLGTRQRVLKELIAKAAKEREEKIHLLLLAGESANAIREIGLRVFTR